MFKWNTKIFFKQLLKCKAMSTSTVDCYLKNQYGLQQ